MLPILVTLAAAFAFGYLLDRLKVPGGMMIGAVIGACLLGIGTGGYARMPGAAKTAAQIIAGGFIGSGVSRREAREMKTILKPAAIVLPGLLLINLACGILIHASSSLTYITAFMGTAPGGLSDMPMIAADLGADTAQVTLMQFVRFMMGIALFPTLIRILDKPGGAQKEEIIRPKAPARPDAFAVGITLLVATASGLLGKVSPMPSGTMAFAVFGTMLLRFFYPKAQVPRPVRKCAQCLSGAFVGAGIGLSQLSAIPQLFVPLLLMIACYLGGAFLISALLVKAGCFGRTEAMLAATPAGASDMALISADLGVRNVKLILLQVLRLIVVISIFPTVLSFVAAILGP